MAAARAAHPARAARPEVSLRIPRAEDAQRLFELASDPEVTRFFSWGPYQRVEQAAEWLETLPERRAERHRARARDRRPRRLADRHHRRARGRARDRRAVVGTWLGSAYWGTGANAESKALIAHLVFGPLRMERLGAWADVRNPRSQRALERLGFVREGTLRAFHRHYDERRDVISYSLLRESGRGRSSRPPVEIRGEVPEAFVCARARRRPRALRRAAASLTSSSTSARTQSPNRSSSGSASRSPSRPKLTWPS